MENVYLKGYPREWHSEKIEELNQYFKTYSDSLFGIIINKNTSFKKIVNAVLPNNIRIESRSDEELKQLEELLQMSQLKLITPKLSTPSKPGRVLSTKKSLKMSSPGKKAIEKTMTKFRITSGGNEAEERERTHETICGVANDENPKFEGLQVASCSTENKVDEALGSQDLTHNNNEGLLHSSAGTKSNLFDFKRPEKVLKFKSSIATSRSELLLNKLNKKQSGNLHKWKDFLVSFRIHEPFAHNEKHKIENFQQEILVLGHQTLSVLRDKIICQSDFQDIHGDLSDSPDTPITRMSRDVYKSAMFYFDNTFYLDCREKDYVDYSHTVKEWGAQRGIQLGTSIDMQHQMIGELKLRFGYPYLYMHQGCCEHLIIVTDARLLSSRDSLRARDYPLLSSIPPCDITRTCYTCSTSRAEWVVAGSDRMIHDVNLMCKRCFKRYHYIGGKKYGYFKAYRYFQKNVIF